MSHSATLKFGRLRSLLWPIARHELGRFLPMLFMYALIVFNYTLLKPVKDALVITGSSSGAAVLPFIKVWAVLPMALIFTFFYTRLSNQLRRDRVFYIFMSIFLGFFLLFGTLLYPLRDLLHPTSLCDTLEAFIPQGLHGFIAIFRNWTYTLFYVMSELWGTTIMTVLFWGFANEITSVKTAKRYYAIFGLGANIATIAAGEAAIFFTDHYITLPLFFDTDSWGRTIFTMSVLATLIGIISMALYRFLDLRLAHEAHKATGCPPPKRKEGSDIKMGMRKNFSYLAKSKYLICIALVVLGYHIAFNMVEVIWKQHLYELCPSASDFNAYESQVFKWVGIASTFFALFFCGQSIRRFGWTTGALVTPIAMLVATCGFFGALFLKEHHLDSMTAWMGITPLALAVFFGALHNGLSRACKFTFFDTTKEIAFIPLSPECKLKGKAAIDGVGSRLGKSGGSFVHQCLLVCFGSIAASTPIVAVILFCATGAWIASIRSLGAQFDALEASKEESESSPSAEKQPEASLA